MYGIIMNINYYLIIILIIMIIFILCKYNNNELFSNTDNYIQSLLDEGDAIDDIDENYEFEMYIFEC